MADLAKLKALNAKATQGVWAYRPVEYDDWGVVRGDEVDMGWEWKPRPVIAQFRGHQDAEELAQHRIEGTDPYGPDAVFTVTLVNAYRAGDLVHRSAIDAAKAQQREADANGRHRFGSPPEPVVNPSERWCDQYAAWYYQEPEA